MKVLPSIATACLLAIAISTSFSCKKIIDEIKKNPGNGVASDCRIDKIISTPITFPAPDGSIFEVRDTAYFSYNHLGNPIRIRHSVYPYSADRYHLDIVFKYDSRNRLAGHLKHYQRNISTGEDYASSWIVYKYNSNGSITSYNYTEATAPFTNTGDAYESIAIEPATYESLDITTYTVDEFGRYITSSVAGLPTKNFNYNTSGNLLGDGYAYSNNLSYLQTHKVWMMIAENFSVNEKTAPLEFYSKDDFPTAFNSKKLPVKFEAYPIIAGSRAESPSNEASMIYICK